MSTHGTDRIAERSAVLNTQTVPSIRIVTAPNLGGIIEHAAIEPASSTTAAFNKDMRIISVQTLQQIINSQDVAVINLSLAPRGQSNRPDIGKASVHIPFQVRNFDAGQHLFHLIIDMVPDILAGKIQY